MKPHDSQPPTLWTEVVESVQRGESLAAERALNEFCRQFRPVIYRFFRQRGLSTQYAEDFTKELLAGPVVSRGALVVLWLGAQQSS
jgi:hypothetical protein